MKDLLSPAQVIKLRRQRHYLRHQAISKVITKFRREVPGGHTLRRFTFSEDCRVGVARCRQCSAAVTIKVPDGGKPTITGTITTTVCRPVLRGSTIPHTS